MLLFLSCPNSHELEFVTELPKKLKENSGIAYYNQESVWFVEDSGNKNSIYEVDFKGNILRALKVGNSKNVDWEDLTTDNQGQLYIGDFGNNNNDRQDLVIYKTPNPNEVTSNNVINSERIEFWFPEQKEFPPSEANLFYDAESLFYYSNHLYIITRNRSKPNTGEALIYKIPAVKGRHEAKLLGTIKMPSNKKTSQITSADISPDGKTLVLLSRGTLRLITDFSLSDFKAYTITEIDLGINSQLESVCFKDPKTLLISDERVKKTGGNLYFYKLK